MIIDTDPGLDDAFALAVARRYADIVGITTVAGNVEVQQTTANALALAELLDIDAPVHSGAEAPLESAPIFAPEVHGVTGLGRAVLPPARRTATSDGAADFLIDATRAEEGLHLVAIGPLTNVALALRSDPDLARRVASITLMGGSPTSGNVTPVAEFNIYADAEAAAETFRSGAPINMVGLNVTHQVRMSPVHSAELRAHGTEVAGFLADVAESRSDFYQRVLGLDEAPMHDPCAVLAVVRPDLFAGRILPVEVELRGDLTRGMTVVDCRPGADPSCSTATVLERVDAEAVLDLIMIAAKEPFVT